MLNDQKTNRGKFPFILIKYNIKLLWLIDEKLKTFLIPTWPSHTYINVGQNLEERLPRRVEGIKIANGGLNVERNIPENHMGVIGYASRYFWLYCIYQKTSRALFFFPRDVVSPRRNVLFVLD